MLLQRQNPVVRSSQFSFCLMLTWNESSLRDRQSSHQKQKISAVLLVKWFWCPSSAWLSSIWAPLWAFLLSPSPSPCLARWNQNQFHSSWQSTLRRSKLNHCSKGLNGVDIYIWRYTRVLTTNFTESDMVSGHHGLSQCGFSWSTICLVHKDQKMPNHGQAHHRPQLQAMSILFDPFFPLALGNGRLVNMASLVIGFELRYCVSRWQKLYDWIISCNYLGPIFQAVALLLY